MASAGSAWNGRRAPVEVIRVCTEAARKRSFVIYQNGVVNGLKTAFLANEEERATFEAEYENLPRYLVGRCFCHRLA